MPTPEELARQAIDAQLTAAGWIVQDRNAAHLAAGPGVAVREFAMPGAGEADYALFAGGKAVGIVEAKKRGETLTGVEGQAANYSAGFPTTIPAWRRPLPMVYVATDRHCTFTILAVEETEGGASRQALEEARTGLTSRHDFPTHG